MFNLLICKQPEKHSTINFPGPTIIRKARVTWFYNELDRKANASFVLQLLLIMDNARISVCMQHIVNLSINTLWLTNILSHWVLTKFFRIRWLMRCTFKFSKWRQYFLMKTIITNHVMLWILDLSYNTRQLQSYNEAATLLCNGSCVRARSLRQHD